MPPMPPIESLLERIKLGRTDLVAELLADHPAPEHLAGAMLWVAYHGNVSSARSLTAAGVQLTTLGPDLGIRSAAFHGHWQLCQFLLEAGASAEAADPDSGETPLHHATSRANRPQYDHVVKVLLRHGADPNRPTIPGRPTGAFMRDVRSRGETPLHRAGAYCSPAAIEMLLTAGADPTRRDVHGDSPLSWASWHLRPAPVIRLLCFGEHRIHPDNDSTYDHGTGWGQMDSPRGQHPVD